MSPFSMVVAIILIVTIGRIIRTRMETSARQHVGVDSADTMQLRSEVRQLRERIQVLERVITDNHSSVDLDRQIERLRDR